MHDHPRTNCRRPDGGPPASNQRFLASSDQGLSNQPPRQSTVVLVLQPSLKLTERLCDRLISSDRRALTHNLGLAFEDIFFLTILS